MNYSLDFTGERYLPWLVGNDPFIGYEHIHRYLLASAYVRDKRVLDIACGEGYGTAMLAQTARSVIGVDNDAITLKHAREYHGKQNIAFVQADAQQFNLSANSVDVIVSFETLEHFRSHQQFFAAMCTALTDDGILFISTPNRAMYSDEGQENNPFHERELYRDEFVRLLKQHFRHVLLFGQSTMANSMIAEATGEYILRERRTCDVQITAVDDAGIEYPTNVESNLRPRYYVAICSNQKLGAIPDNLMVDNCSTLLHGFVEHHRQWSARVSESVRLKAAQVDMDQYVQTLTVNLGGAQQTIAEQQQTIAEQVHSLNGMQERIDCLVKREGEERAAFFSAHQQLLQRDNEILRLRIIEEQLRQAIARKNHEEYIQARQIEEQQHTIEEQLQYINDGIGYIERLRSQSTNQEKYIESQQATLQEQLQYIESQQATLQEQLRYTEGQQVTLQEQQRYIGSQQATLQEQLQYIEGQQVTLQEQLQYIESQAQHINEQARNNEELARCCTEQEQRIEEQQQYIHSQTHHLEALALQHREQQQRIEEQGQQREDALQRNAQQADLLSQREAHLASLAHELGEKNRYIEELRAQQMHDAQGLLVRLRQKVTALLGA